MDKRQNLHSLRIALALVMTAGLVAACGSSASNSPTAPAGSSTKIKATTGAATVEVKSVSGYGEVLANAGGKPLYLLTSDPANQSRCDKSCAVQWPPLTVDGSPLAGSGVQQSLLASFKRSDGQTQVSYNSHALYTYNGPSATAGAGMASEGGVWYLVSPAGNAIKSTTSGGY